MPDEIAIKCPSCGRFLAALEPNDKGVRVACHGLSLRVDRIDRAAKESHWGMMPQGSVSFPTA